jgi:hypothetical protein
MEQPTNKVWTRTCQECGHQQVSKLPPSNARSLEAYFNAKCRKCKSESLDYGTYPSPDEDWVEEN